MSDNDEDRRYERWSEYPFSVTFIWGGGQERERYGCDSRQHAFDVARSVVASSGDDRTGEWVCTVLVHLPDAAGPVPVTSGAEPRRSDRKPIEPERHERWTLSLLMTGLRALDEKEGMAHDDVAAFHAPGECHAVVSRSFLSQRRSLIANAGWTLEELEAALAESVSGKWLYKHGLGRLEIAA